MIYKNDEIKQVKTKTKILEKENIDNEFHQETFDKICSIDEKLLKIETEQLLYKQKIDSNLEKINDNIILLTKNIDKLSDLEKAMLEQTYKNNTQNEQIKKIEDKINWITKLFISTIFVIGLNFIYNINDKKDDKKQIVYLEKTK